MKYISSIFILMLFSGCSTYILSKTYGIDLNFKYSQKELSAFNENLINSVNSFSLDSNYLNYLVQETSDLNKIKNHIQPLQVLYFNSTGYLESYHINCNTGGFPNLNWIQIKSQCASELFPKTQTEIDSVFTFEELIELSNPMNGSQQSNEINEECNIIVFWSLLMKRQSRRLIKLVKKMNYVESCSKCNIIYMNNDMLFSSIE